MSRKAKLPAHMQEFVDAGGDLDKFYAAQKWLFDKGITLGPKRGPWRGTWALMCVEDRKDGPTVVILWLGTEALLAALSDLEALVSQFREKGANVRLQRAKWSV